MKIKKILLIGSGNIGLRHLSIVQQLLPKAIIKVMHHKNIHNKFNKNYESIKNLGDALKFSPNLIIISNPTSRHVETALKFTDINSKIFIEKPLSNNLTNIDKLVRIWRKEKLFISIGYNLRYLPSLIYFKKIIEKNSMGKLYHFYSSVGYFLPDWRKNKDYRTTVSASKRLGGGVLLELSHEIDYIRWIFGEINSIYSKIRKQSNLKINVEDTCKLFVEMKSTKRNKKVIGILSMDFLRKDKNRQCTLIAEKGTIKWDGNLGTVDLYDAKNHRWKNLFQNHNELDISYVNQWKDIIKRINGHKDPNIDIFDGIKTLEIIDSARLSNSKNKEIKIKHRYKQ